MSELRIVAIDDEALALRRIEIALGNIKDVELVGTARGGREGLELIDKLKPDVLLLDINMAGFGGFDVVQGLGPHPPLVIFVTAFDEHAVRAFQVSALDYLLKPLEFDLLRAALDKARTTLRLVHAEERAAELKEVIEALRHRKAAPERPRYDTELWAPRGPGFQRVFVADIDWIEAERDYVHLHTNQSSYLLRETMSAMETRLDPEQFLRVHRSALVRIDRIASVRLGGYARPSLLLTNGTEVPVARSQVKRIRRLIGTAPAEAASLADCA